MPTFTKDSFVQNLAKGRLVVPYLEQFEGWDFAWEYAYKPKETDDAWHPSGDCTPSVGDLHAKALGGPAKKFKSSTLRNFQVGHFWHALLQQVLCHKLEFCEPEAIERQGVKVWGWSPRDGGRPAAWHWATGSGDIVPLELPNGWRGLFDIKTIAGSLFRASWKSGLLPPAFAAKYEAQVNIYMDLFNEERALILGVNKDNPHGFVEFEFERNQDMIDLIYEKWEYVSLCLDAEVEPDPAVDEEFELPFTGPIN